MARNGYCQRQYEDQGQYEHQAEENMKRLLVLILVWTLLVLTGTLVSADGQNAASSQIGGSQIAGGDTSVITDITK